MVSGVLQVRLFSRSFPFYSKAGILQALKLYFFIILTLICAKINCIFKYCIEIKQKNVIIYIDFHYFKMNSKDEIFGQSEGRFMEKGQ